MKDFADALPIIRQQSSNDIQKKGSYKQSNFVSVEEKVLIQLLN